MRVTEPRTMRRVVINVCAVADVVVVGNGLHALPVFSDRKGLRAMWDAGNPQGRDAPLRLSCRGYAKKGQE
jgi:hypothetical protein